MRIRKYSDSEFLVALIEKGDYSTLLSYADLPRAGGLIDRLLASLGPGAKHGEETEHLMARFMAKLHLGDLIETVEEYVELMSARNRTGRRMARARRYPGPMMERFLGEISRFPTLVDLVSRFPGAQRSKWLRLEPPNWIRTRVRQSVRNEAAATVDRLEHVPRGDGASVQRVLLVSPAGDAGFSRELAAQRGAYHIQLGPELAAMVGGWPAALRLVGEVSLAYHPFVATVDLSSVTDVDEIAASAAEDVSPGRHVMRGNAYLVFVAREPESVSRAIRVDRLFHHACYLPPSTPEERSEYIQLDPSLDDLPEPYLAAVSRFYAEEEMSEAVARLAAASGEALARELIRSDPYYNGWLRGVKFLRSRDDSDLWASIAAHEGRERRFSDAVEERFAGEFVTERLALADLEEDPQLVLSVRFDPLVRFVHCLKERHFPDEIRERLFSLVDGPMTRVHGRSAAHVRERIYSFLVVAQDPAALSSDAERQRFADRACTFAVTSIDAAAVLLSTEHPLSTDHLRRLAVAFRSEMIERKVMFYITHNKVDDTALLTDLALTFDHPDSRRQAVRALRALAGGSARPDALSGLFSLLLVEDVADGESRADWLCAAEELNSVNSRQNFNPVAAFSAESAKRYGFDLRRLFRTIVSVMADRELIRTPAAAEWVLAMLSGGSVDALAIVQEATPAVFDTELQAFRAGLREYVENPLIPETSRAALFGVLADWDADRKFGLTPLARKIATGIDFSRKPWADLPISARKLR